MTPFIVMDVLERANEMERQGVHVIHLEVGEPDFDTPQCIKDAACKALDNGHTHYTHSLGMIELREAISEHYLKTYGVSVDPDQIVISSGTSPAMFVMFSALLEKGDQVIVSDPHTKGIFINSPSNPTGNLLSKDRMEAVAALSLQPDSPYIISDEIYHGLVYEGKEHSILEFTEKAFVLNGFSKLYAMTGLRLGYMIAPKHFIRPQCHGSGSGNRRF